MPDVSDMDLLLDYQRQGSEEAFAELVRRHVNLVYSAALRHAGIAAHAEEITQAVFVILARKAAGLRPDTILDAWLYETTRWTALSFLRGERRRQWREQEAYMQSTFQESTGDPVWHQLSPLLDEAMSRLGKKEREAVVLRFFKEKSLREVAAAMQVTEAAAQSRVHRALEKLHRYFARRGVSSTTAIIAGAISANSVQAAPVALAKAVSAVAAAKGAAASGSTLTLIKGALKLMAWTKAKTAIVSGVVVLLAAGTTTITVNEIHVRQTEKLWRVNKDLPSDQIDKLPPMVRVLPTKFQSAWVTWNTGSTVTNLWVPTYGPVKLPPMLMAFLGGRVHFAEEEPTSQFDFVATLPQGSRAALQRELKVKLGLVGRRETENMDVLLLKVNHANAPGLKPPNPEEDHTYWSPGVFHSSNATMDTGAPRFDGLADYLERYFKMPVIDQTDFTQYFSFDLRWKETRGHPNHEGLEQVLLNQLGLELVPTNMPIEMLVVENVK